MLVVVCLVIAVDILLLASTARLLGKSLKPLRLSLVLVLDVVFVLASRLPALSFVRGLVCRGIFLLEMGCITFGISAGAVIFTLLQLSLGSITDSKSQILPVLCAAAGLGFACLVLGKQQRYVPVELTVGNRQLNLTALRDTGNSLRDPITGRSVLVVDAKIARQLTGLTLAALQNPVEAIASYPELRLIPYQTVGGNGFLLGLQIPRAKVGNQQGSVLVALSPQILSNNYQALTGGIV